MIDYIRQGDCLELMKDIPDKSIDLVLCDLPYGTTRNKWDTIIPLEELWGEYKRLVKENGAIVLFSQLPFTATLVESNKKMFRYEWVWNKTTITGFLNANKMPMKSHENILVFYNKLPTYNPQKVWGGGVYTKIIMPLAQITGSITESLQFQTGIAIRKMLLNLHLKKGSTQHKSLFRYLNISLKHTRMRAKLFWTTAWVPAQHALLA